MGANRRREFFGAPPLCLATRLVRLQTEPGAIIVLKSPCSRILFRNCIVMSLRRLICTSVFIFHLQRESPDPGSCHLRSHRRRHRPIRRPPSPARPSVLRRSSEIRVADRVGGVGAEVEAEALRGREDPVQRDIEREESRRAPRVPAEASNVPGAFCTNAAGFRYCRLGPQLDVYMFGRTRFGRSKFVIIFAPANELSLPVVMLIGAPVYVWSSGAICQLRTAFARIEFPRSPASPPE
jgi:hypothetical protein